MNKQIEEMTKNLTKCACECEYDCSCSEKEHAEILYNAGYRKQVEGEWIEDMHDWDFTPYDYNYCTCSVCGNREQIKSPYCRECGARMKGE